MDRIVPLNLALHDRKSFTNKEESIARYLHQQAAQDVKRGYARIYILAATDNPARIAGYMSLNAHAIDTTTYPPEIRKIFGSRRIVPLIELGRLGVDTSCEGQGIGKALVFYAIQLMATNSAGAAGLLVKALNPGLIGYYEKLGFTLVPGDQDYLFLDRRIAELMPGEG